MILKFDSDPNEIYFVESTGNYGVALNKWSQLRKHIGKSKFYKKCIFRHLEFERDENMLVNLEEFLKLTVGCKY